MNYIVKSFRVAAYHYRQITATPRILLLLSMEALFIIENLRPIILFSADVGIPATPFAFPHLTNDFRCQLVLMAGTIILYCDAPFEEREYIYFFPRAGRFAWGCGQIIYVVSMAFFYTLFVLGMSILPFIGHLEFGTEWGKIWGTLAKTDAGLSNGMILMVTEHMVSRYDALPALFVSFILEWACVVWLGMIIYTGNKFTNRPVGTMVGAFGILLDLCIKNGWAGWANKFSITLAQLNTYAGYNLHYNITLDYGKKFFLMGIGVLIIMGMAANYKDRIGYYMESRVKKQR